jgi:CRISPR-associated endonuclease/helicase Cas3
MDRALAHVGGFGGKGHLLVEHLRDVVADARRLAEATLCDDPTFLTMINWAAWLHDLGKYRDEFQEYLKGRRPKSAET